MVGVEEMTDIAEQCRQEDMSGTVEEMMDIAGVEQAADEEISFL